MAGVSLPELPDRDDTVRLLLLLLDPDRVDVLELEDSPDSDPDPDPADPELRPVFAVRLELDVRSDLEDRPDTLDPDDSSEMEDTLVLEVIPDTVEGAVVDLFFSGSGSGWMWMILDRDMGRIFTLKNKIK